MTEVGFVELLFEDVADLLKVVRGLVAVRVSKREGAFLVVPTVPRRSDSTPPTFPGIRNTDAHRRKLESE